MYPFYFSWDLKPGFFQLIRIRLISIRIWNSEIGRPECVCARAAGILGSTWPDLTHLTPPTSQTMLKYGLSSNAHFSTQKKLGNLTCGLRLNLHYKKKKTFRCHLIDICFFVSKIRAVTIRSWICSLVKVKHQTFLLFLVAGDKATRTNCP